MKLEILIQAIKDINHEKTLYFLELDNINGQLLVSDISSTDLDFIIKLAEHVEYDYRELKPVNQTPTLYNIQFY